MYLLPLWAFVACSKVNCTFTLTLHICIKSGCSWSVLMRSFFSDCNRTARFAICPCEPDICIQYGGIQNVQVAFVCHFFERFVCETWWVQFCKGIAYESYGFSIPEIGGSIPKRLQNIQEDSNLNSHCHHTHGYRQILFIYLSIYCVFLHDQCTFLIRNM